MRTEPEEAVSSIPEPGDETNGELRPQRHRLAEIEELLLHLTAGLQRHRRATPNVNEAFTSSMSRGDRLALKATSRVGTFQFFLVILIWSVLWLGWNLLAPQGWRFDPGPAFVLWLFISNLIQLTLLPLIMIGQNLQGRHSELRGDSDYEVNKRAEQEVQTILLQLERLSMKLDAQNRAMQEFLASSATSAAVAPANQLAPVQTGGSGVPPAAKERSAT